MVNKVITSSDIVDANFVGEPYINVEKDASVISGGEMYVDESDSGTTCWT